MSLDQNLSTEQLFAKMKEILVSEREAIRKLDAETVLRASAVKEEILKRLKAASSSGSDRAALALGLEDIKPELRRNLILLAHARNLVKDAIDTCGKPTRGRITAKL